MVIKQAGEIANTQAHKLLLDRTWNMAKNDYQALADSSNPFIENSSHANHETIGIDETTTDTENEDGNRENGIMIHVVPDTSKGMWSKILDRQFNIIYLIFRFLNFLFSPLESYRRLRLVFYTNVLLPSKAWIQCDDGQLYLRFGDFRICRVVCQRCSFLYRLSSSWQVSYNARIRRNQTFISNLWNSTF